MEYDAKHCMLCPRRCGGDRSVAGGICKMPEDAILARAALHFWEEPCISGTQGAGTVFFSGCSLQCVYCQNYEISRENFGQAVHSKRLQEIFAALIAQGAHNIDLVNPTHFSAVLQKTLKAASLSVPLVWNSGGYERVETLRALDGLVDIYLPDFKYPDGEGAGRYSHAPDYPNVAKTAICEMLRQTGPYVMKDDLLTRGVIIRHLILPGRVREAKAVMDWVAETFPAHTVLFSLMSQYVPLGLSNRFPELNRCLYRGEIRAAIGYMESLGLDGYTQDATAAATHFVPEFDLHGVI
ncbi:MAG: 4Fe-4S cluster-binding domain-containing protein [Evtepia sp.]